MNEEKLIEIREKILQASRKDDETSNVHTIKEILNIFSNLKGEELSPHLQDVIINKDKRRLEITFLI